MTTRSALQKLLFEIFDMESALKNAKVDQENIEKWIQEILVRLMPNNKNPIDEMATKRLSLLIINEIVKRNPSYKDIQDKFIVS